MYQYFLTLLVIVLKKTLPVQDSVEILVTVNHVTVSRLFEALNDLQVKIVIIAKTTNLKQSPTETLFTALYPSFTETCVFSG